MGLFNLLTSDHGRFLCLPAHGRGAGLPDDLRILLHRRAGVWDLPELPELGGPLQKHGAVAQSQEHAAEVMGAERCWYGVNGATGLLQAALLALARPGEAVLMPRNVHRSLIQACALGQLTPVLFDLPFLADRGHVAPPDQNWLNELLDELPASGVDIAAAVLVHPTYHGYARDLKPLVLTFHGMGIPVLVDEAHGTHFASGVEANLPKSALAAGADLIVHSLHKSAGGLAQTAVLWLQGNRVDPRIVERSLSWFQTTSPSSLLLASCEAALDEWRNPSGRRKLTERIQEARGVASMLIKSGLPLLQTQDPLRLILHTAAEGISGLEADRWFIQCGIVAELPEPGCLTFCLGLAPHKGLIRIFKRTWDALIRTHGGQGPLPAFSAPPLPRLAAPFMSLASAWSAPGVSLALEDAVGRITAELICPYPPGIPLVVPGEKLDRPRIDWLVQEQSFWPDQIESQIRVVAE